MRPFLSPIILVATLTAGVAVVLFYWGRWVARRHRTTWWRCAAWLPMVGLLLTVISVVITGVYISGALEAVSGVGNQATKATRLADNIAGALDTSALLSLPATALYALSLLSNITGSVLRPRGRAARVAR